MSKEFTSDQFAAINHGAGPALVSAGPGAGKTAVLTERIAKLLKTPNVKVLAITFTNAAAEELEKRVQTERGADTRLRSGTFHSVFYETLRSFGLFTDFEVLDEKTRLDLFTACLPKGLRKDRERCLALLNRFDCTRNKSGLSSAFFDEEGTDYTDTVIHFQALKRKNKVMDFEDMEFELIKYLPSNSIAAQKLSTMYDYVLVDEFQDINPVQYELLMYFIDARQNLFAVGDEDQSIYGFRGSDPSFLLRFKKDFPSARFYTLYENFRSHTEIVNVSLGFIASNQNRFQKKLIAHKGPGGKEEIFEASSRRRELYAVRDYLLHLHDEGISFGDMAVLFRQRSQVDSLAAYLANAGIPVRQTVTEIRKHESVLLDYFLAFLEFSTHPNTAADSFETVAKSAGLKDCFIREVIDSKQHLATALANLPDLDDSSRIKADELLYHARQVRILLDKKTVAEAISYIFCFAGGKTLAERTADKEFISTSQINRYIDRIFCKAEESTSLEEFRQAVLSENCEGVYLGTIHGAKGLEFTAVCCMGVAKGILPHRKSVTWEEIEEERRLLYVGMTRAKQYLLVSGYSVSKGHRSQFMKELKR